MTDLPALPLTAFDVETRHGLRLVEVRAGDILRQDFRIDVLVISAFEGDYTATPGSVVGALAQQGLDVRALAGAPALDLRSTTGAWLSPRTGREDIGRVLCLERRRGDDDVGMFIRQGLATLAIVDTVLRAEELPAGGLTVAMPLLGTGDQGLGEAAVDALLAGVRDALERSLHLARVVVVVRDPVRAEAIAEAVNQRLGLRVVAPGDSRLAAAVRDELRAAYADVPPGDPFWDEARKDLDGVARISPRARSIEIGIHGRRFVERLVTRLGSAKPRAGDLHNQIEGLRALGVAPWIVSYMHVIRALGNEAAHARDHTTRRPAHPDGADAVHAVFCLERLVRFAREEIPPGKPVKS